MKPIIKVQNIGKEYCIGARQVQATNLREKISQLFHSPFGTLRRKDPSHSEMVWALKDVSFEIKPGEVVGIIGRNGAGKSTLLKILSRITEPTSGRIELYGRIGSLLEVGTGFHPELSGRENVFLNGAVLGMTRAEIASKFDEIIAFSEIDKFIDTPVKHYSSGMYLRLAFAVAAHLEPEVLIVDEVLAVGDAAFQKKCTGKMHEVSQAGRTVIFVSHSMESVRKLCDWAILLEKGRVLSSGDTEMVLQQYLGKGETAQSVYAIPPPKDADTPAYAYKLIIEDKNGEPTPAVPVGQPWQVRVHFKVMRKVEQFRIALGLATNTELPLQTSWSSPQTIEPGDYQAVFREETIIMGSGRYSLRVGLSSYETQVLHYSEDAGILEIADFSVGINLVKVSNVGLVLNPFQIEIHRSNN